MCAVSVFAYSCVCVCICVCVRVCVFCPCLPLCLCLCQLASAFTCACSCAFGFVSVFAALRAFGLVDAVCLDACVCTCHHEHLPAVAVTAPMLVLTFAPARSHAWASVGMRMHVNGSPGPRCEVVLASTPVWAVTLSLAACCGCLLRGLNPLRFCATVLRPRPYLRRGLQASWMRRTKASMFACAPCVLQLWQIVVSSCSASNSGEVQVIVVEAAAAGAGGGTSVEP